MKRLIVLSAILSLGFGAAAWACDGGNAPHDKKDQSVQSQAEPKGDQTTAPVKNTASTVQSGTPAK